MEPVGGRCPACGEILPLAPVGRFDPAAAELAEDLVVQRGFLPERRSVGDAVEVLVDPAVRDSLRAELAVNWPALLANLPPKERALLTGDGMPGWRDAPEGAWVDREGRLRVSLGRDEEDVEDASRMLGPALVAAAMLLALLAWYAGDGLLRLVAAIGAAGLGLVGLLIPR